VQSAWRSTRVPAQPARSFDLCSQTAQAVEFTGKPFSGQASSFYCTHERFLRLVKLAAFKVRRRDRGKFRLCWIIPGLNQLDITTRQLMNELSKERVLRNWRKSRIKKKRIEMIATETSS
jgi:hypothetical protein